MPTLKIISTVALLTVTLVGCGTTLRDMNPAVAETIPLPEDTQHIYVTDGGIEAPYRELAVVRTQTHRREDVETLGVSDLRLQAARLGANAVIHVQVLPELTEEMAYSPGSLFRAGFRWVTLYRLSGVAVVIEGGDANAPSVPETPPLELNLPPL